MGYNTSHSLVLYNGDSEIIEQLREECDEAKYALNNFGGTNESSKWYESDDDMKAFSKKHPQVIFELSGIGEEGEHWRTYFKDGKLQRSIVKTIFSPFDESKLV